MTSPIFKALFPEFSGLGAIQHYDTDDGAANALADFERRYLTELGDRHLSTKQKTVAASQAFALVEDLTAHLRTLVAAIMPSELATENSDYSVENLYSARLAHDEQFARLTQDLSDKDPIHFRILNGTLEQNLQALLDHLTASRIAEEMDTPTYVERLRGGFKRVRDGARALGTRLEDHAALSRLVAGRIAIVAALGRFLKTEVVPRLDNPRADATHQDLKTAVADLEHFASNAAAFSDHFRTFLSLSQNSLTRVHRDFASDTNMSGAEGESILVSRDIERHAFYRPKPFVWALIITALVKIVLAHNTSETLHYLAVPLLVLSFVLTWTLSIYIGVWARASRMKDVQRHIRNQLKQVLHSGSGGEDIVEFPRIAVEHDMSPQGRLVAYPYRGRAIRHKRTVLARNLWALLIRSGSGAGGADYP